MLRRRFLALLAALGGAAASAPTWARSNPGYAYYEVGDMAAARPRPTRLGLMLLGGGDWPYAAFRWLFERAGGGRMVVLRASYGGENGEEMFRQIGGVTGVQTLVFSHRRAASDPRVLEIVRGADGIFLGGGDQSKYVRFWKGTPLNALIDEHVRAGKPIGGTSAGLAVLGAHAYGAMDGGSIDAKTALRDPLGPQVTLVSDFLHLPFLQKVITDSHFMARNRLGRLIAFVARLAHEQGDASIAGIGVDENTALCIDETGVGRIITDSGGSAWLVRPRHQPERIVRGRPLTFLDVPVTQIATGGSIRLDTLEVTGATSEKLIDIKDGSLVTRAV